jgi:hypothetical protein
MKYDDEYDWSGISQQIDADRKAVFTILGLCIAALAIPLVAAFAIWSFAS